MSELVRAAAGAAVLGAAATLGVLALGGDETPRARRPITVIPIVEPPGPPALGNRTAYIPPQCYATTRRTDGKPAHNGCATCHQAAREPNFVDDEGVQSELSIPQLAAVNPWRNVIAPPAPAALDDAALDAYVRENNYRTPVYDCAFAPDAAGWDRTPDGAATGWRAYLYTPMPGMFWPTNGSAGDAFIRLPAAYRQDASGAPNDTVYAVNLAIVEAYLRRADVAIAPVDEAALGGIDLDADGRIARAAAVAFVWPPDPARPRTFVGAAAAERAPAAGLFPAGTELVHSLRYLDVVGSEVRPAARMKEVRYMRKLRWLSYSELDLAAKAEAREKEGNPDLLKRIAGDEANGLATGTGWRMQGYIEDAAGALRPQTVEETAACIGCHGGVGANVDSTFSFARKLAGDAGWSDAGTRGFVAMPERGGEYRAWLEAVGGGDDFRANTEVAAAFLDAHGKVPAAAARRLAADIRTLIVPSPARARALDAAYLAIVHAQRFVDGREAILGAPAIEERLEQGASTGIELP